MAQSKAYLLGQLLAVLEREGALLTPTPQRSYELASVNPTPVVVPAIAKLNMAGKGDSIMDIMVKLPIDAFNGKALNSEEQGQFTLGYYHEKAGVGRAQQTAEEDLSERLEIRLSKDLKMWTMQHGGATLIRSLLRAEQSRQEDGVRPDEIL